MPAVIVEPAFKDNDEQRAWAASQASQCHAPGLNSLVAKPLEPPTMSILFGEVEIFFGVIL